MRSESSEKKEVLMKNKKIIIGLLTLLFLLFIAVDLFAHCGSCPGDKPGVKKHDHHTMEMKKGDRVALNPKLKLDLNEVLENASMLSTQIFKKKDFKAQVKDLDMAIDKALKTLKSENQGAIVPHKGHLAMMLTGAKKHLQSLKGSSGKDQINDSLGRVSKKLSFIVKKLDVDRQYNLFFCGMVRKPWIAKGTKVNNPYESDSMPHCGSKL